MGESEHPYAAYFVRVINGVAYVNDAQATTMDGLLKAVEAFDNIYLIAGGKKSEGSLDLLQPVLDKIRHVYLLGDSAEDFAQWFSRNGITNTDCNTIDIAVIEAHAAAQFARGEPGGAGTVLLSPGTLEQEEFRSPEHLGMVFTEVVGNLSVETPE